MIKIQSPFLTRYNSRYFLAELIRLSYALGQVVEFIGISKQTTEHDFTKITLVAEDIQATFFPAPSF